MADLESLDLRSEDVAEVICKHYCGSSQRFALRLARLISIACARRSGSQWMSERNGME